MKVNKSMILSINFERGHKDEMELINLFCFSSELLKPQKYLSIQENSDSHKVKFSFELL